MNPPNSNLDKMLKGVHVPERPMEYWDQFSGRVMTHLRQQNLRTINTPHHRIFFAWGLGLVTTCIVLGFIIGFWSGHSKKTASLAGYQKLYHELTNMFPNQVLAVIIDDRGTKLVLAENANIPSSTPLLLKICKGKQCQDVITLSGQQVQVNGETCEVLLDAHGNVILVGNNWYWSSKDSKQFTGRYYLEAKILRAAS